MRRVFGATIVLVAQALPAQAGLPEREAPRVLFPEAPASAGSTVELTDAELASLSMLLGKKVEVRTYRVYTCAAGTVFILDAMGQTLPITFAIGVQRDGALRGIEVLAYREPRGQEIEEARFRKQFAGKRLKDPLSLGADIEAISGATISSRSATYAARKALSLAEILRRRDTK